jgi:ribosomal protein S18 acetylase RimI-like enzyme
MGAESGGIVVRRIGASQGLLLRAVRLASLADAPGAFGRTYAETAAIPASDWEDDARASADGAYLSWFLAWQGDTPVGVIRGARRPPATLIVLRSWVEPAFRRRGIGSRLMDAVETWALDWGATDSRLWVSHDNEPAIAFYRRLGYVVIGARPDAEAGSERTALAMRRAFRVGHE